jgi:hypothetical protein
MRAIHDRPSTTAATDRRRKDFMQEYGWMQDFPGSADDGVRCLLGTLAVWLGTDGAAETLAEIGTVADEAARNGEGSSLLADLACGWLTGGEALDTLAQIHAASLALTAIAEHAPAHITAEDPVSAVLAWLADPGVLDVLSEISAASVRFASLTGASEREIADGVAAWQGTSCARTTLARISTLTAALAKVAGQMSADEGICRSS